ncbi:MAG: hypothetical protein J0I11_19485 [Actinobacteria bacterium]|nr:hypothetical protein [Actinomycetota bacterium]
MVTMTVAPGVDTTGIDIEGAKAAYYSFVNLSDQIVHDPTQQWESEIRKYAVEPAVTDALDEINNMRKQNVRSIGHTKYSATLISVGLNEVNLRICTDSSGLDTVNRSTGQSVKADQHGNHPQSASMVRNDSGTWFLREIHGFPGVTC